ncbi:MAG: hypothetical protein ACREDR_04030, partial [Blastocatellia bacterium]
ALMPDQAEIMRVGVQAGVTDYFQIATTPVGIMPPGQTRRDVRAIVTGQASFPIGGVYVPAGTNIQHKDRLVLTTQGDRTFDVIAPITPRRYAARERLSVREVVQPERELWLIYLPDNLSGMSGQLPAPTSIVRVLPVPMIVDDPIETVSIGEQFGQETASLARYSVTEIPYSFLANAAPNFCLIVTAGVDVTEEDVQAGVFPHYRMEGTPNQIPGQWSVPVEWKITLVQDN